MASAAIVATPLIVVVPVATVAAALAIGVAMIVAIILRVFCRAVRCPGPAAVPCESVGSVTVTVAARRAPLLLQCTPCQCRRGVGVRQGDNAAGSTQKEQNRQQQQGTSVDEQCTIAGVPHS